MQESLLGYKATVIRQISQKRPWLSSIERVEGIESLQRLFDFVYKYDNGVMGASFQSAL